MATKSGLISAINAQITAVITQAKHRLSMLEVVNELFPTTTNYALETGSEVLWYNLNFKKIGSVVYVDGYVQSKYSYIVYDPTYFVIPSGIYTPKRTTSSTSGTDIFSTYLNVLDISGIMFIRGTVYPESVIYVNFNYTVND